MTARTGAVLTLALPCAAQTITDGDTLKQNGVTYRLWGIATRLQALTAGRQVVCQEKDRDRYGRPVVLAPSFIASLVAPAIATVHIPRSREMHV